MTAQRMSPREYGRQLAEQAPPLAPEQARAAARILANVPPVDPAQEAASHDDAA